VATGLNDAAGERTTSEQQPDHRNDFDAHDSVSSITVLVAICRSMGIATLLPPLFLPSPMLHPTMALLLTLACLSTMLPAARTAAIAIPIGLLNGKRLPDR
jgi:hypothetical protein